MNKSLFTLLTLVLFGTVSVFAATTFKVYELNPPTTCAASQFTVPAWQTGTSYFGVAANQLGNAWVQNAGKFYKNVTGVVGNTTSGATGPTCSSGTCSDGAVLWAFQSGAGSFCTDEIAHYVWPSGQFDGVSKEIVWSSDQGDGAGIESSNGGNTASAGYSYSIFDGGFTNGSSTGYFDNPNWPAGGRVVLIPKGINNGGSNLIAPNYVFSTTYATAQSCSGPLNVGFTSVFPGTNHGASPFPVNQIVNINTAGMNLATLTTGWPAIWECPYQKSVLAWYANVLAHYSAISWHAKIDYSRVGFVGTGGETFVPRADIWKAFYGDTTAQFRTRDNNGIFAIYDAVVADAPAFPLETSVNCGGCKPGGGIIDNSWTTAEATHATAESTPIGLGNNGYILADIGIYGISGAATGSGISGDFAYTFSTFTAAPILELQTSSFTDPTNASTGSLLNLLPFASARCPATTPLCTVELFWQDWCVALCPDYIGDASGLRGYSGNHTRYLAAITAYRAGNVPVIAAPSQIFGSGRASGQGKVSSN